MDTIVKFIFLNFKIYLALWSKNLKFKKFQNSFKKIKQIFETWWEDKTTFYD